MKNGILQTHLSLLLLHLTYCIVYLTAYVVLYCIKNKLKIRNEVYNMSIAFKPTADKHTHIIFPRSKNDKSDQKQLLEICFRRNLR